MSASISSPKFEGKAGAYPGGAPYGSQWALPSNIRLGWERLRMSKTLAYFYKELKFNHKSFIVQATGALVLREMLHPSLMFVVKASSLPKSLLWPYMQKLNLAVATSQRQTV